MPTHAHGDKERDQQRPLLPLDNAVPAAEDPRVPYDAELADRVREALAHRDVAEKKMFGALGFMVDGHLALAVGGRDGRPVMVRVGPDEYPAAVAREGAEPAIMGQREMKGWVFLLPEAVETDDQLAEWVELALDFVATLG